MPATAGATQPQIAPLLPLDRLGARERPGGLVEFGILLPGVTPAAGDRLSVRIIHERDQFLQDVPAEEFELAHGAIAPWGDWWHGSVEIRAHRPSAARSAWGEPGRYVYRYCLRSGGRVIDGIIDPCAREFGVGKLSAFTLGYEAYRWSEHEQRWRTPRLRDLVVYELQLAEFAGGIERTTERLQYLADLGVNAVEVMPVSNVAESVDWGYEPLGYFGVDERFGRRSDFQRFVDQAHQRGIAVILDAVYAHVARDFPYEQVYSRLGRPNPFIGAFAGDSFGCSTDFRQQLTRDFFLTVNHHWLDCYHVDGFRYDYVPGYWDGPMGVGYARLVHETRRLAQAQVAAGRWQRFAGDEPRLIQCAEQLEAPQAVLRESASSCTWQDRTRGAALAVARGEPGGVRSLGFATGLDGFPDEVEMNGERQPRTAFQYLENHDHERFLCAYGLAAGEGEPLFAVADRSAHWFRQQPHLIALLTAKGVPLLWQGQELAMANSLPGSGRGRIGLLRPVDWNLFYDEPGRATIRLVRRLLRLRRDRAQLREGAHHFHDHERWWSRRVLLFSRWTADAYSLVALNFGDQPQTVPFWFPIAGDYREELHGAEDPTLALRGVPAGHEVQITIPSNYGRIWSAGG